MGNSALLFARDYPMARKTRSIPLFSITSLHLSKKTASMKFTAALKSSFIPMLQGLVLSAYLSSLLLASWMTLLDHGPLSDWIGIPKIALALLVFALLYETPVALMIWWPIAALLLPRGNLTYLSSALIPFVLALFGWLLSSKELAALIALYGVCFAVVAQALLRRTRTPSPPTPPRDET
jgi:hypothetical protein